MSTTSSGSGTASGSGAEATARRSRPVIAIDGPAGAGKSTLAAHLARRFGFLNLETGAMYRALALKAMENELDFDSEPDANCFEAAA
jgi:cytidylate kinase